MASIFSLDRAKIKHFSAFCSCEQQSVNRFLTPLTSPQSMKGAKKPRSLIPRWIRSLLPGKSPTPEQSTDLETLRDLRCVSWLLQNSVDEDVHTSAMNFLMSAPDLAEIIQMQYRDGGQVPDWILRFALHCLSLDPLPPASTVAECLKIIAFDLRCEVPNVTILDKGAEAEQTCSLIAEKLETAIEADDSALITSKREAVCALLPYAIFLEQGDRQGMVAAIIRAAKASKTCWFFNPVGSYITALFGKPSSSSLNWLLTIVSPHIDWENKVDGENAVVRWAAAASAVPDTEEVRQSVVDTLLQIASIHSLRPHIPIEIWAWLKKRPSLPPVCSGRSRGTTADTIRYVRGLGDFEIVKSYFLLVWSEWDDLCIGGLDEMETSIREEFGGIGMWGHREDLIGWLDYVLERLGRGLEYLEQHNPQVKQYRVEAAGGQYRKLKEVLVDADGETMKTLNLIPHLLVLCLFLACDNRGRFCLTSQGLMSSSHLHLYRNLSHFPSLFLPFSI
ncbi:hypothetical protein BJ322DRAFT_493708 [Thelephora terrestris]|uniref:Uncharacterized protein n=1 Tax=Thelephora terrestris TaxID=56493 RepID=A0A9P6L1P8_9AGAM|nr:hypothetical protein BJ322DRAFT_493708 [Thelephora terrestris]